MIKKKYFYFSVKENLGLLVAEKNANKVYPISSRFLTLDHMAF